MKPLTLPGKEIPPVLTIEEVADLLRVSVRKVHDLPIKSALLGRRTRRFLTKHVLEYVERRAE